MANHIAEVAQILGVEIGETFKIADDRSNFRKWERYYRFTNNGMEMSKDEIHWEKCTSEVLEWLIKGEIDIKLPWKPQNGEFYFSPSPTRKSLKECLAWVGGENDNYRLNRGFVFRTPDEAVAVARKMLTVAREEDEND
mgnify:FL=1